MLQHNAHRYTVTYEAHLISTACGELAGQQTQICVEILKWSSVDTGRCCAEDVVSAALYVYISFTQSRFCTRYNEWSIAERIHSALCTYYYAHMYLSISLTSRIIFVALVQQMNHTVLLNVLKLLFAKKTFIHCTSKHYQPIMHRAHTSKPFQHFQKSNQSNYAQEWDLAPFFFFCLSVLDSSVSMFSQHKSEFLWTQQGSTV